MNFSSNASWGAYTIVWGDGQPNTTGGTYPANTIITHTYTAAGPTTYTLTLTIPGLGCTMTGTVVMEKPVNSSIQIPIGGITTACAPKALQFTNSSTDVSATTTFTWTFGDGTPPVVFNSSNAGQTVTHTYNPGTVNCQTAVTLSAMNFCTNIPTIANFNPIQIYDIDNAQISPSAFIKCFPDNSFTFNNTTNRNCVPQGNTFQRQERWNLGNYWGLGHDSIIGWRPWPPTAPLTVMYPGVGNYTVSLADSNLCGVDVTNITVSIVNPPTAGAIGPVAPVCAGASITFTNTSATGYTYKWNFGTGGGFVTKPFGPQTFTYSTAGQYTVAVVALINGAGTSCTDTDQVVVNILPRPTANFSVTPNKGCNSITGAVFTDNSTGGVTTWNWNFGNGVTSTAPIPGPQNYNTVGSFVASLTVTAANTCVNSFTAPITVYQTPTASFVTSSACVGSVASFSDTSVHAAGDAITSWKWNFGDASPTATTTVQNPNHTYTIQNTYTVQLIVNTANCADTIDLPILINVKPTANFTMTPISGCPTLTVNFTNTSLSATSYTWNFGNSSTSTATNVAHLYTNTTTANQSYTISLFAQTGVGCADTKTASITVFPKPTASFTLNALAGCSPVSATFSNTSVGGSSYLWDFGDNTSSGTASSVLTHTYINNTLLIQTFTVQLNATSSNGCKDSTTLGVTVYPRPVFNFTMIPGAGCSPLNVNFPPVLGAVNYQWDFGDGSPVSNSPNPTHTFTNTTTTNKTFTVQLIASNAFSCVDTTYGFPIVYGNPIANFNLAPNAGCSPLPVTFTNTSTFASNYIWRFGDGATSTALNPSHTYTNSTNTANQSYTAMVVAITANNCRDSITNSLTVFPKPKAAFNVDTPSCSPKLLTFTNASIGAGSYEWTSGGPTTFNVNEQYQFINNTGANITRFVRLIAISGSSCRDTLTVPVIVHPKPEFTIVASPDSGCTALTVNFPAITGATSCQWNFGDGTFSGSLSPTNVFVNNSPFDKIFTVQLIATNNYGCRDTSNKIIKVFPRPIALFQANPNTVFVPNEPVLCSNLSSGAISFDWSFGDNTTSTDVNPSHNYQQAGSYQITLIATNSRGCKDTFDLPSKIIAENASGVDIPNAFSPNQNGSNGGGFNPKDINNDVFHPVIQGVDKYELNIFSRWGELLFVSKDVNIGWDGYYKGKLCTQDVYIWKIVATTIDDKKINKTGDVLLLR
jgi:gliding motility-associated-like protein